MRHLSGKEKKELRDKLPKGFDIDKKDEIVIDNRNVVSKNGTSYLLLKNSSYLPHLKYLLENENNQDIFPQVFIDKGAIPFLLKGADMMRPGIQKIVGEFEKGDVVLIKDENHNKLLGMGFSKFSHDELKEQTSGKSIEVFHYINDEFY